jgi:micrococcal nuclease
MKRILLIGCCITFFIFSVLLPLLAENIDDNIQDYATELDGIFQRPQDTGLKSQNVAVIVRVVDGDTIKVNYIGKTEHVKLIGIDAPENKLSRKAKNEAVANKENLVTIISMGIDAEKFMKNLIKKGDVVTIEFDAEQRDANGDLLGYVFLTNGKMLNEEIVRAGYAHVVITSRNAKYNNRLLKASAEAKAHKRGIWE